MTLTVNGIEIGADRIEAEAGNHAHCASPQAAAAAALAIRELLVQRARATGLLAQDATDDLAVDAAIEKLLEREATVPQPTEAECRRYFERHKARFARGELVEASHILFAVTPNAQIDAIRRQAETTLREARAQPDRFGELARMASNCPSGAQGGNLGQIGRGDTVPEFEQAIFGAEAGVLPRLVNTRYGFHVVRVERSIPGTVPEFDAVRAQVQQALIERARMKAAEQYVRMLAAQADLSGVDLRAAASPLVQ
jgi:peptidyl-prolyl cis-trans isomerase C